MPTPASSTRLRRLGVVAVGLLALGLGSCGLAEAIADDFVDDQDVTLFALAGSSGSVVRTTGGTDLAAQPDVLAAGDAAGDTQVIAVFVFRIDGSLQPDTTSLDTIRLRFWLDVQAGDPAPLGPLVLSRLPTHPDAPLTVGQVPHPPGDDLQVVTDVTTPGWRELDITNAFKADWYGGRTVTAYALRLATPTDSDATPDLLTLEGVDGGGQPLRPHVVLHFTVDL